MAELLKLNNYEIKRELGHNTMGAVYEAFDPLTERRVAIKTIRTDNFDRDNVLAMLNRFEREAKAASRLTHPNIAATHDYGKDNDTAHITMEFVPGKPLAAYLAENMPFEPRDAVRIVVQILDALEHAHHNGVVHRDIRAANILVLSNFDIKVVGFGLGHLDSPIRPHTGRPRSMSPEQSMGITADRRTDIFSAGAILYELFTGRPPFDGNCPSTTMQGMHAPPPPSEINTALPREFDAVVLKALAEQPDQRFQTASDFSKALKLALNVQTAPAPHAPAPADEPLDCESAPWI